MAYQAFCAMNNAYMMSYGHHVSCANNKSRALSEDVIVITSVFCAFGIIISKLVVKIRKKLNKAQGCSYDSA